MNAKHPEILARLTPWQRDVSQLAPWLGNRLSTQSGVAAADRILWWGAGYSELLEGCGRLLLGEVVLAETEPRRLRRCQALAGEHARAVRLLDLADLRRDAASVESALSGAVVRDLDSYLALEDKLAQRGTARPTVPDGWASAVVADFVLNRVGPLDQPRVLGEAFRVLSRTGRLLVAVLVADEPLPGMHAVKSAPAGPTLGLPSETALLAAVEAAGFHGISLYWPDTGGMQALDRIGEVDIRMCIVEAYKGKQGPCLELGQAVMYGGPWREVRDDDGHVYPRGQRVAVCAKTYDLLMRPPYEGAFVGFRSVAEPRLEQAAPFDCNTPSLRDPKVTKGMLAFSGAQDASAACAPGGGCC